MGKRNGKGGGAAVMDPPMVGSDGSALAPVPFHITGTARSEASVAPQAPAIDPDKTPPVQWLHLDEIVESSHNTRKHFDQARLEELAQSMRTTGQTTPVLVRPDPSGLPGVYELAAGHRRYRAAKLAGITHLLAIVREMDDNTFLEILTIENLQREDVHPLEEADGYAQLLLQEPRPGEKRYDVDEIARKVGKSSTYIYDTLKLRTLIPAIREIFFAGRITPSHAIELSRLSPADQERAITTTINGYQNSASGGLWRRDQGRGDTEQEDLQLEEAEEKDPTAGLTAVSVRELKTWIREHTRFDTAAEHVPVLFPETAKAMEVVEAEQLKVINITYEYRVADDAKDPDGQRTYGNQSWTRADGLEDSKECDHSVMGVVVVGPGQGQAFRVCIRKDKCEVHYGKEIRAARKRAKEREAGGSGSSTAKATKEPKEQPWERDRRLADEARARFNPAIPAIVVALEAAVGKAPTKGTGPLGQIITRGMRVYKAAKFPVGKTADDFVRHLAWSKVANAAAGEHWAFEELPKLATILGVDVKKIVAAAQPKADKASPAKAPAKKTAKKKGGKR